MASASAALEEVGAPRVCFRSGRCGFAYMGVVSGVVSGFLMWIECLQSAGSLNDSGAVDFSFFMKPCILGRVPLKLGTPGELTRDY